jgi:hypothetical protein
MRIHKTKTLSVAALLISLAISGSAYAVGEVAGRISGTITEQQSGAPVPGATITVSGKNLIGGARNVTTDDSGRYEVVELPPGPYDVEVSYSGVKPIKRRVVVRQGETLPLDIQWSAELAEAEVTVVVEERHMTKPDSSQSGTVITIDQSDRVATSRSYQDIARQVAGVVDVNGGGNPQIKGANLAGNKYLVDGLDITDPVTSTFSANINFDSISSIEIVTGGMEAQYNALGGVINLITQGGSDEWHVNVKLFIQNGSFSAPGNYGSQLYQADRPFVKITPAPTQSYQAVANVGGPILKHRLWFHISLEYDYTESAVPAGPPLNYQAPPRTFNGFLGRLKLTWAPNDKHRVTLSVSTDPAVITNLASSISPNYNLPIAMTYQKQGGAFAILQWDYFITQNINTNVQTGFQFQELDTGPQPYYTGFDNSNVPPGMYGPNNYTYSFDTPQHFNFQDNTVWYQGQTSAVTDKRYRFQFDPSISLRGKAAGHHDAKLGLQFQFKRSTFDVVNSGKGVSYQDLGGGGGEGGLCNEMNPAQQAGCYQKTISSDYNQYYQGIALGAFIQDRWKPVKWLTIQPGIRLDYGWTQNSAGQTASSQFAVGPRLGFNFDLTKDQKTILVLWYGRASELNNLLPAAYGSPSGLSTSYYWDAATSAFDIVASRSGGPKGYRFDPNATAPHTDEVYVALRRELFANSVGSIEYTYKRVSNMWDWKELNQIWDPTGYRLLGYVDNANPQQIRLITTPDRDYREYQGVDFSIEARPNQNWDIYFAYTLAFTYGPGAEQFEGQINGTKGQFYNPRQTMFYQGFLPEDVRHNLKLRASYHIKGFTVGGLLQYITGATTSKSFFNYLDASYTNLRSPQGTDPGKANDPNAFAEIRLPDVFSLDVRAQYDFHALIKQHITLLVDFFNLFNIRPASGIDNTNTTQYGQVTSRISPFRFQLGLTYAY